MSIKLFRRCCNPFSIVKYLRFRLFAVLLGVVSLTSLALVFHRSFGYNSAYSIRLPFLSADTKDDLVKNKVENSNTEPKDVLVMKNVGNSSAACRLPVLDPFHSSVVQFVKDLGKLRCDGVSYSSFENNVLRVEGQGIISAKYRKIERTPGDDFGVVLTDSVEVPLHNTTEQAGELYLFHIAKYFANKDVPVDRYLAHLFLLPGKKMKMLNNESKKSERNSKQCKQLWFQYSLSVIQKGFLLN